MQTSTLSEIVKREDIPVDHQIFYFYKESGKGVIKFDLPAVEAAHHPLSAAAALKRLQALQIDLGRPTNSVKIVRALRREQHHRRTKSRSSKIKCRSEKVE